MLPLLAVVAADVGDHTAAGFVVAAVRSEPEPAGTDVGDAAVLDAARCGCFKLNGGRIGFFVASA